MKILLFFDIIYQRDKKKMKSLLIFKQGDVTDLLQLILFLKFIKFLSP